MEIIFAGATGTVTGSKFLVRAGDKKLLVDCGLFQGYKYLRRRNRAPFPFELDELDGILLTHAHIDHSGYLPRLVKQGYEGPVVCTEATSTLCEILLPDSGRLQEEDASYAKKKGFSSHDQPKPLYSEEDAQRALELLEPEPYNQKFSPVEGLDARFKQAGHILGASLLELDDGNQSVLFSGDLGRPEDPLMNPPEPDGNPDFLVMESTYGNRLHGSSNPEEELAHLVNKTVDRGGTVLIPSFAVGRAQSLSFFLQQLMERGEIPEDLPVYLDSPMAVSVSRIFNDNSELHRLDEDECQALDEAITYTNSVDQSKAINRRTDPCVIISASGMATGGRVLHHLKVYAPKRRNLVLFAGYQAPGTRGAKMLDGAEAVKIHGSYIPVEAEVQKLENLSAHADYGEMLNWLKSFDSPPEVTYLVHGEPDSTDAFRQRIEEELGWSCRIPEHLGRARLEPDNPAYVPPEVPRMHV